MVGGIFCFLSFFAASLAQMAPHLTPGDAGELAAAAKILGVAHSPGYPLYLLLGKAMMILPAGSLAYRMNLLSVLCSASSVWLAARLWRRWLGIPWVWTLPFALLLLWEPHWLSISSEAEVFSLLALGSLLTLTAVLEGRFLAGAFAAAVKPDGATDLIAIILAHGHVA